MVQFDFFEHVMTSEIGLRWKTSMYMHKMKRRDPGYVGKIHPRIKSSKKRKNEVGVAKRR